MKACSKCRVEKPFDHFHASAKAKDKKASWCKTCANKSARVGRKRNYTPEQKSRWAIKSRYGLQVHEVEAMRDRQDGRCGVCREPKDKFHIDHDHLTGKVRGLVCHRCNILLGGWDDAEWRLSAAAWIGFSIVEPAT